MGFSYRLHQASVRVVITLERSGNIGPVSVFHTRILPNSHRLVQSISGSHYVCSVQLPFILI